MKSIIGWLLSLTLFSLNGQEVHIQGGGTLEDWANLSKYRASNVQIANLEDPNRIVFMGNSITEGWLYHHPEFFEKKSYINRGIGGQTTPQMLIRFKPDVVNLNPKAVVLLAGINDIAGNTGPMTLENIFENIASMAEIAAAHNIQVVLCAVLPAKDFPWRPGLEPAPKVKQLNEYLKKYCAEKGHIYVDYYSALEDGEGGLKVPDYTTATDLVHPNRAGYLVMETLLEQAFKKLQ
ncbi:MAG: SGNH/GDSL hydrolase family protein [Bacteroidetes bacterium]|nr:SGNH/GDSL hydrolase family protein [Bacteroidota bacterium]MDA0938007.1 SGNH/GDSL hydrolase family protein [Bacteroidota bacterium]MDA1343964.1 SGNH/GDSL hydrolase family protein [Bacteroidota bacterium]